MTINNLILFDNQYLFKNVFKVFNNNSDYNLFYILNHFLLVRLVQNVKVKFRFYTNTLKYVKLLVNGKEKCNYFAVMDYKLCIKFFKF